MVPRLTTWHDLPHVFKVNESKIQVTAWCNEWEICRISNNSAGACSIATKFTTDYDHMTPDLPQTFKIIPFSLVRSSCQDRKPQSWWSECHEQAKLTNTQANIRDLQASCEVLFCIGKLACSFCYVWCSVIRYYINYMARVTLTDNWKFYDFLSVQTIISRTRQCRI